MVKINVNTTIKQAYEETKKELKNGSSEFIIQETISGIKEVLEKEYSGITYCRKCGVKMKPDVKDPYDLCDGCFEAKQNG